MARRGEPAIPSLAIALLASDGSPGALRAGQWLRQNLAEPLGVKVVIVTVRPGNGDSWPNVETRPQDVVAFWHERLATTGRLFAGLNPPPVALLREGDPAREILKTAAEVEANLIVLGSRGHGPLAGAILGSVSLAVAGRSPLPVLVVPDQG